jgi:hypothetical protein
MASYSGTGRKAQILFSRQAPAQRAFNYPRGFLQMQDWTQVSFAEVISLRKHKSTQQKG